MGGSVLSGFLVRLPVFWFGFRRLAEDSLVLWRVHVVLGWFWAGFSFVWFPSHEGAPSVEFLLGFWIRIGQFGAEAEDLRVGVAATAGFLSFRSVLGFPESKPTRVSKLLGGSRIGQPSVLNGLYVLLRVPLLGLVLGGNSKEHPFWAAPRHAQMDMCRDSDPQNGSIWVFQKGKPEKTQY